MDVVIRPVNDSFLKKVAFPAFEAGVLDASAGVELLLKHVKDPATRVGLEILVDSGLEGSFFGLDSEKWVDAVYQLLFWEWVKRRDGWYVSTQFVGYAGDWHETLHLALMLEHPRYPYWDEQEAAAVREACVDAPYADLGLAALVCGLWDPFPSFPPDQVVSTIGRGAYHPAEEVAIADWCFRPAATISYWNQQLATKLGRLLKREETRLRPLEMPESNDILQYWLGDVPQPPVLTVAFSGLGRRASEWVRDIGFLVRQVRVAAENEQGLTAIVTTRGNPLERTDER
ncbi:MAG TPA: hypothetical protein VND93_22555 [Myxococcales bacterium]|jgi:hypothetical protein|nr:hypothetical protein [Myxococcales bacterium]